tara:strand:- start:903 stop:1397 length:495 start_codon:yes stop_codon:yes gene_type:complete
MNQKQIEEIMKSQTVLAHLTEGMETVDDRRFYADGFMPLNVETIGGVDFNGIPARMVSVCQYGEQSGDLMRDPEVVFIDLGDKLAAAGTPGFPGIKMRFLPASFRNDYAGYNDEVIRFNPDDGDFEFDAEKVVELIKFVNMWMQNLVEQGFVSEIMMAEAVGTC